MKKYEQVAPDLNFVIVKWQRPQMFFVGARIFFHFDVFSGRFFGDDHFFTFLALTTELVIRF